MVPKVLVRRETLVIIKEQENPKKFQTSILEQILDENICQTRAKLVTVRSYSANDFRSAVKARTDIDDHGTP